MKNRTTNADQPAPPTQPKANQQLPSLVVVVVVVEIAHPPSHVEIRNLCWVAFTSVASKGEGKMAIESSPSSVYWAHRQMGRTSSTLVCDDAYLVRGALLLGSEDPARPGPSLFPALLWILPSPWRFGAGWRGNEMHPGPAIAKSLEETFAYPPGNSRTHSTAWRGVSNGCDPLSDHRVETSPGLQYDAKWYCECPCRWDDGKFSDRSDCCVSHIQKLPCWPSCEHFGNSNVGHDEALQTRTVESR